MPSPTEPGAICVADLGGEQRHRVLVLSSPTFHRSSSRVVIAPEIEPLSWERPGPWHIVTETGTFAVDLLRTMTQRRLLSVDSTASYADMRSALALVRAMT